MLVTLFRHYKVRYEWKWRYSPEGYRAALKSYDEGDVIDQHVELPMEYQETIISSLRRTLETKQYLLGNDGCSQTSLLDEVPMAPFTDRQKEYSLGLLNVYARLQWLFNDERQPETRKMTMERVNEFIATHLQEDKSYLVIGHGFFLRALSRGMLKHGFKGKAISYLKNGQYHTFELSGSSPRTSLRNRDTA